MEISEKQFSEELTTICRDVNNIIDNDTIQKHVQIHLKRIKENKTDRELKLKCLGRNTDTADDVYLSMNVKYILDSMEKYHKEKIVKDC